MSHSPSMQIAGPAARGRSNLPVDGPALGRAAAAIASAAPASSTSPFADRLRTSVREEIAAAGGPTFTEDARPLDLADRLRSSVRGDAPGRTSATDRLVLGTSGQADRLRDSVRGDAGAGAPGPRADVLDLPGGRPADQADRLRASVRRARGESEPIARAFAPEATAELDAARAEARGAAEEMVATLFVQPLLDAALERSGDGPFAPGTGEKTFAPLLNQRLADEIVRGSNFDLVDAVVDSLVPVAAPTPTSNPSTDAAPTASAPSAPRSPRDA